MFGIKLNQVALDLIINIINILILFVIVRALVYKPVKKFLNDRTEQVNRKLDEADSLLAEAKAATDGCDQQLEECRKKGEKILADCEAEARKNASEIVSDARDEAALITEKARKEAASVRAAALGSMQEEIGNLAIGISEKILAREVSEEDNRRLVEEYLAQKDNVG